MTDVSVGPTDTDGMLTSWHSYSAGKYKRRAVDGPQLVSAPGYLCAPLHFLAFLVAGWSHGAYFWQMGIWSGLGHLTVSMSSPSFPFPDTANSETMCGSQDGRSLGHCHWQSHGLSQAGNKPLWCEATESPGWALLHHCSPAWLILTNIRCAAIQPMGIYWANTTHPLLN